MITADASPAPVVRRGRQHVLPVLLALAVAGVLWFLGPEYLLYVPVAGSYLSEIRSALP